MTLLHPKQQCTHVYCCIKPEALAKTTRVFLEEKALTCTTDTHERAQMLYLRNTKRTRTTFQIYPPLRLKKKVYFDRKGATEIVETRTCRIASVL